MELPIESYIMERNKYKSIDDIMLRFSELEAGDYPYINLNSEIFHFLNGEKVINRHAVYCITR